MTNPQTPVGYSPVGVDVNDRLPAATTARIKEDLVSFRTLFAEVPLYGYGNSWMDAAYWFHRLPAKLGFNLLANKATGGFRMQDTALTAIAPGPNSWTPGTGAGGGYVMVNDLGNNMGDPDVPENRGAALASARALAAVLSTGTRIEQSAFAFSTTPGWSATDQEFDGASTGRYAITANSGAYADVTIPSAGTYYLMAYGGNGVEFTTGIITVTQGGRTVATVDTNLKAYRTTRKASLGVQAVPIRLDALTAGTIRITHTNGGRTGTVYGAIDFVAPLLSAPPTMVWNKPVAVKDPAYTGKQALLDFLRTVPDTLATEFPNTVVVDPAPGWKPDGMLGADLLHPNAEGSTYILDVVSSALVRHQTKESLKADSNRSFWTPLVSLKGASATVALRKWRAALAAVASGSRDAKVLAVGDSITAASVGATNLQKPYESAYTQQLASMLSRAVADSARGLAVPPSAIAPTAADDRWTAGTGWSRITGFGAGKGAAFTGTAPSGSLVYADSGVSADTFDVYYLTGSGLGTLSVVATGGSPVTQPTAGAQTISRMSVSAGGAGTANSVTITATGGAVYVVAVEPRLATGPKRIRVGNAGVGSSTSSGWAATPTAFSGLGLIGAYAPDMTIINLGINDASQDIPVASFRSQILALVDAALLTGSVLVVTNNYVRSDQPLAAKQQPYVDVLREIGSVRDVAVVDVNERWGPYSLYSAMGMISDPVHPNAVGLSDMARAIFPALAG